MKEILGGVTAPIGFKAAGMHAGFKKLKPDLALVYSEKPCAATAVFTTNLVKAAPVQLSKKHVADGKIQAVIINSGNANACTSDGMEKAQEMAQIAGEKLNVSPCDIIVSSTGVIGQTLDLEPLKNNIDELVSKLEDDGGNMAATAIMTTDTFAKEAAVELEVGGKPVKIGGMTKGSGMIKPNMATMLGFITTDCNISADMLQKANKAVADKTFNMISVDGDTSTNDTFAVLANGMAENKEITEENEDYMVFVNALEHVAKQLSMMMAKDGEGATKLLVCKVSGADAEKNAKLVAKGIVGSNLLKAAMFGEDANWGRVICAVGYSGAEIDVLKVDIAFESSAGKVDVCKNGMGLDFSEELAAKVLSENEIDILVELNSGEEYAESYGCDLTYDYVKINGDYRS